MASRIVFLAGSSRSSRRRATVTSSQPEASSDASISPSLRYLPVPRNRRERSSTPAITSESTDAGACAAPPEIAVLITSLRWHYPVQVSGGRPSGPLSPDGAPAFLELGFYAPSDRCFCTSRELTSRSEPMGRLAGTPGRRGNAAGVGVSLGTTTMTPRSRAELGA